MSFESPNMPKSNFETLQEATLKQLYMQTDPRKIILIAKALGIRTFLQKTAIRELVASSLKSMDEDQLKMFLESNSELLGAEDEEEKGRE